jgi:hypothetical protein
MSHPIHIQAFLDSQVPFCLVVDKILNDWTGEGCYQLPVLLMQVATQMNWDNKQLRAKDPLIREYIRNHPTWYITRGAHGGVMRRSEKEKKDALAEAKRLAKEELSAKLTAEVAAKKLAEASASTPVVQTTDVEDNTNETV